MGDRKHTGENSFLRDGFGRPLGDLRLSVTDRCNLRCVYCIPEEAPTFLDREELLTFEEMARLVRLLAYQGIRKLRVTGGEPLLRRQLPELIERLALVEGIEDIAMTTNGTRLLEELGPLVDAGLQRINISLDTLRSERFRQMTRRSHLSTVVNSIRMAQVSPLRPVKVNVVLMRGFNDDEIEDFGAFGCETGAIVRFIEFMPLEAGDVWSRHLLVPGMEVYERLHAWSPLEPVDPEHPSTTAERFRFLSSGTEVGIIAPVTRAFCGDCNRVRITAEGMLRTCLFAHEEVDLKTPMRAGAVDEELSELIVAAWGAKEPGHLINSPDFVRPSRTMSAIGG